MWLPSDLAHLLLAVEPEQLGQVGEQRIALGEHLAEAMVEAARDPARELDVLHLILADRHELGLVEHDVGGLQDRVLEQAGVDVLGLRLGLVLELCHALEVAEPGDVGQNPRKLGVLGDHRLKEQERPVRIDAERDEVDHHLGDALRHLLRVVVLREGVIVDDAEHAAVLVLQRHPVAHGAEVVAEMELPRWLDPREDRFIDVLCTCGKNTRQLDCEASGVFAVEILRPLEKSCRYDSLLLSLLGGPEAQGSLWGLRRASFTTRRL